MISRKSHHKPLKRSPMRRGGRKVDAWAKVRSELKAEFERNGVTRCEMCGRTSSLSFAHRLKRRFITDDDELRMVALLCMDDADQRGCHNKLEHGGHEAMFEAITEIIEARGLR